MRLFGLQSTIVLGKTMEWSYVPWHQKDETTNSPIHEFNVLQNIIESL